MSLVNLDLAKLEKQYSEGNRVSNPVDVVTRQEAKRLMYAYLYGAILTVEQQSVALQQLNEALEKKNATTTK